jgi:hypothetical protein
MDESWVPAGFAIVAAVFGFIGVVTGGIVTGYFTIRAERIRADKEAALDSAKRQDDRVVGRDNFQRETLLALQETASDLVALAAKVNGSDESSFAKTGKWRGERTRTAPTDSHLEVRLSLRKLQSRAADEGVRRLVDAMVAADATITAAADRESARKALADIQTSERQLIARSGDLILQTFPTT